MTPNNKKKIKRIKFIPNQFFRAFDLITGQDYICATNRRGDEKITLISKFGEVIVVDSWISLYTHYNLNTVNFSIEKKQDTLITDIDSIKA